MSDKRLAHIVLSRSATTLSNHEARENKKNSPNVWKNVINTFLQQPSEASERGKNFSNPFLKSDRNSFLSSSGSRA